ncbi:MAG: DUF4363 family protein, partial [Clostridia bacterium]|nr:DUF4363 family protein [Clostridia bacterium]
NFVNQTVEELTEQLDLLPARPGPESTAALSTLSRRWEETKPIFSFSVSTIDINRVSAELTALISRSLAEDEKEYLYALAQLKLAIQNLGRLEQFSVLNLL